MLRERLLRGAGAAAPPGPKSAGGRTRARTQPHVGPSADEHDSMVGAFLNLPDAVVLIDAAANVVWGNRSAERLFERTLEDWAGQSGLELVHPADQEFVLRSLSTIQDKEVGTPIEIRIKATSGWRLVELIGATTEWFGNKVVLLCMRDLTERRRFEVASGQRRPIPVAGPQRRIRPHAGVVGRRRRVGLQRRHPAPGSRP